MHTDMTCTVAWTLQMQALCKWTLIEPEQSLCARKRKQKQGVTKAEERERDRVSKSDTNMVTGKFVW